MEKKVRIPMPASERAKQFMPFAALKGFEAEIEKREKMTVPKAELSEEMKETLDREFAKMQKLDMVEVVYFCKGEYRKITGLVARIDVNARLLTVVNKKISFDDIYRLHVVK